MKSLHHSWARIALASIALPAFIIPALAHNFTAKGYGQLKADSEYFAHAKSGKAKINQPVPNFAAPTLDGGGLTKASFKGKIGLLLLADTSCPCVQAVEERVKTLSKKYQSKGLKVAYVFSMPGERPIQIARFMQNHQIPFPAIIDKDQRMLKMLDGQCFSEVYLFDKSGILRYHGRVDDSTFDPSAVKNRDLENAIVSVTKGTRVAKAESAALGCAIPRI